MQGPRGGDLDHFSEAYGRFLPGAKVVPPDNPDAFRWKGALTKGRGRALWRARLNRSLTTLALGDSNLFGVILPKKGTVRSALGTGVVTAAVGQALVLRGKRKLEALCHNGEHARVTLTWHIPDWQKLFALLHEDYPAQYLDLHSLLDFTPGNGEVFFRLFDAVAQDVLDHAREPVLSSGLMSEALLRLIFEKARFSGRRNDNRPTHKAPPRQIRLAVEYMHVNISRPICIHDIAIACRVTMRTLEAGFRNYFETTPTAYLRRIRLDAVRNELAHGETAMRISEVARRWGFVDMGRFAVRYREAFGETPSQTLRGR